MKKILAWVLVLMVLSALTLAVSAASPLDTKDIYNPAGEITIDGAVSAEEWGTPTLANIGFAKGYESETDAF